MNVKTKNYEGFTLVEMAVVLVILGLLIATFLTPLSAQLDQARNTEANHDIQEIKEVLLGYVVVNSRLPCPDTDGDGIDDGCANTNATSSSGGNIPWVDLGLKSTDPWGRRYQYRVNNAFSTNFLLSTVGAGAGVVEVCTNSGCAVKVASSVPVLIFSLGKNGDTLPPVSADEQENTNGDGTFVSHEFSDGANAFDDLIVWIPSNLIMSRMVSAQKLP